MKLALVRDRDQTVWTGRPVAGRPAGQPTIGSTLKLATQVVGGLATAAIVIAAIVRATVAAPARRWLAYPYTGVRARPDVAAGIFAHNALVLAGIVSLVLVLQARYHTVGTPIPRRFQLAARWTADWLLGALTAVNLCVIGTSFGAYGSRMVRAALPHGPVEACAFALALALYLQGRDRPFTVRHVTTVAGLALAGLAVAALLEAYVTV